MLYVTIKFTKTRFLGLLSVVGVRLNDPFKINSPYKRQRLLTLAEHAATAFLTKLPSASVEADQYVNLQVLLSCLRKNALSTAP